MTFSVAIMAVVVVVVMGSDVDAAADGHDDNATLLSTVSQTFLCAELNEHHMSLRCIILTTTTMMMTTMKP